MNVKTNDNPCTRREFVSSSTRGGIAGTAAAGWLSTALAAHANSGGDRLRIGVVGAGRRGFGSLTRTLARLRNEQLNWSQLPTFIRCTVIAMWIS